MVSNAFNAPMIEPVLHRIVLFGELRPKWHIQKLCRNNSAGNGGRVKGTMAVHYTTYSERVGGQQKVKNKFNLICDEGPSCQHFQGHPAAIEIDRASKSLMSQGFQSLEFHPCIYIVILTIWTSGLKHYRINWHTFMVSFLKLYKHVLQPKP